MLSDQYVAGFFDGEGCVNISMRKPTRGQAYTTIRATIANTHIGVLLAIQERFGGAVRRLKGANSPVYVLNFDNAKAVSFIEAVRPYASVKAEQMDVALEFWAFKRGEGSKLVLLPSSGDGRLRHSRPPETLTKELEFKNRLHVLKGTKRFYMSGVTASTLK